MKTLTTTQWGTGTLVESDGNRIALINPAGTVSLYTAVPPEIKDEIQAIAKQIQKEWNLERYWEVA
jgi:hypothetical protein